MKTVMKMTRSCERFMEFLTLDLRFLNSNVPESSLDRCRVPLVETVRTEAEVNQQSQIKNQKSQISLSSASATDHEIY